MRDRIKTAACVTHEQILDWYAAWNRRDWSAVSELLADRFALDDIALQRSVHGKADYLRHAKALAEAFPDGAIKIERVVGSGGEGELVLVEYALAGTQSGHWGVFPPSHRRAKMFFCDLLRFEYGKLASCISYTDLYGPLCQLGHVISAASTRKGDAA